VSKTLGATINDVFMACVAGSVRRYAETNGRHRGWQSHGRHCGRNHG